jgi:hypothetical protein
MTSDDLRGFVNGKLFPYLATLQTRTFCGKERREVQQNFPIKTGETAFLFMQHFIKSLKAGAPPQHMN